MFEAVLEAVLVSGREFDPGCGQDENKQSLAISHSHNHELPILDMYKRLYTVNDCI